VNKNALRFIVVLLLISGLGFSQPGKRVVEHEPATVCMYRIDEIDGLRVGPALSIDEEPFGYLQDGRFWCVVLPAGDHIISIPRPKSYLFEKDPGEFHLEIAAVPGAIVYIQCQTHDGFEFRFLNVLNQESAKSDIRLCQYGSKNQIINRNVQLLAPFNQTSRQRANILEKIFGKAIEPRGW
jgi:hypothetical protein